MKRCSSCNREWNDQMVFCPIDGNALTLGVLLNRKYRLEQKIGEGGMGIVYRATHTKLDTTVAVKVLHPRLTPNEAAVERFLREARAAAKINHDNAIKVSDFDTTDGVAYFVMEFLDGMPLGERMAQGRLSLPEIALILRQICAALEKAHAKGILHRDLKPDNIYLDTDEDGGRRVKVLDFGIAKFLASDGNSLTAEGMIVGTPQYMSPEQGLDQPVDVRSDVYSLGVILYEMLTGQVPFRASTPMATLLKHIHELPKPLRDLCPDIPRAVETVVLRTLSKTPAERPASARQLSADFDAALRADAQTVESRPATPSPEPPATGETTDPMVSERWDAPVPTRKVEVLPEPKAEEPPPVPVRRRTPTPSTQQSARPRTQAEEIQPVSESSPMPAPVREAVSTTPTLPKRTAPLAGLPPQLAMLLIGIGGLFVVGILFELWTVFGPTKTAQQGAVVSTPPVSKPVKPPAPTPPPGMVFIAGGTFTMGNNASDDKAEKPEHPVTVKAFFLDRLEVTNEDYLKFVAATGRKSSWGYGNFKKGEEKHPVVNINWADAKAYAAWAGKRLPTEAEWEYAARGTDKRLYPWGNGFDAGKLNSSESGIEKPKTVGSFPEGASPFGVLDMAGNVAEWTASDYELYPGSKAKPLPNRKIVRGGSFLWEIVFAMTTTRMLVSPDTRNGAVGFRCAKDAQQE